MEFFRDTSIDFLGKKWYFLTFSLIFSVAGVLSMAFWHGIPLGVDFRGGTLVYVKYAHTPDPSAIHNEIERAGLKNARVQRYGPAANNEVLIALDIQETSEQALDKGKLQILQALESHAAAGKQDLNNSCLLYTSPGRRMPALWVESLRLRLRRTGPALSLIHISSYLQCLILSVTI